MRTQLCSTQRIIIHVMGSSAVAMRSKYTSQENEYHQTRFQGMCTIEFQEAGIPNSLCVCRTVYDYS